MKRKAQAAELTCNENWRVLPKFSHLWDDVCSLPLPFWVASVSFCSSQSVNSHFLIWQTAPHPQPPFSWVKLPELTLKQTVTSPESFRRKMAFRFNYIEPHSSYHFIKLK